jgi:hypothetical protein
VPAALAVDTVGRLLVIDVGFVRTKLAIVSIEGCEHQEQLPGLGTSTIVHRVLRDGQDQGLWEDEFAVLEALESPQHDSIVVSGRRFRVDRAVSEARRALEEDLLRAAQRTLVDHCGRRGEACRAAAIIGGGSVLGGPGLKRALETASLGLDRIWVSDEPCFLLVEGARRAHLRREDSGQTE